MISQVGLSSSRDCREVTEKTMMKACPLEMLSRCMAGNWWLPVVSVICSVQIEFLLHVITCQVVLRVCNKTAAWDAQQSDCIINVTSSYCTITGNGVTLPLLYYITIYRTNNVSEYIAWHLTFLYRPATIYFKYMQDLFEYRSPLPIWLMKLPSRRPASSLRSDRSCIVAGERQIFLILLSLSHYKDLRELYGRWSSHWCFKRVILLYI